MKIKQFFTSGEVAKICRVTPRTVCGWADAGIIPCFTLPATSGKAGERRFSRENVAEFVRKHGFPPANLYGEGWYSVLTVGFSQGERVSFSTAFPADGVFDVYHEENLFGAGEAYARVTPSLIVFDVPAFGAYHLRGALDHLFSWINHRGSVVLIFGEDASDAVGFSLRYRLLSQYHRPLSMTTVAEEIRGAFEASFVQSLKTRGRKKTEASHEYSGGTE